jgi:D-arabinose 1-dehydrogenase-like Zn-dependent alcohol dehydrogenase
MLGSTAVRARAVMKALRKMSVGPGLSLETVPVPTIGQRDVLVRTKIASICGTDMHIQLGSLVAIPHQASVDARS